MAKVIKFSQKSLEKCASDNIALKPVSGEFRFMILAFCLLRRIAQAVSIASGFCFFFYKIDNFITGFPGAKIVSIILSISMLLVVEAVVQYSLDKSFKFGFKRIWKTCAGCGLIAIAFFYISFFISTEGIYLAVTDTHEMEINISKKWQEQRDVINESYKLKIDLIEKSISEITESKWYNGFTPQQQEQRKTLRDEITSLMNNQKIELEAVDKAELGDLDSLKLNQEHKASDYYMYVCLILLLDLLCSGVIVYFDTLIWTETEKEYAIKEEVSTMMNKLNESIKNLVHESIEHQNELYSGAVAHFVETEGQFINSVIENSNTEEKELKPEKDKKIIAGFNSEQIPTTQTAPKDSVKRNALTQEKKSIFKVGICEQCGKEFQKRTTWQKYCSEPCKYQHWADVNNKEFIDKKTNITYYPSNKS